MRGELSEEEKRGMEEKLSELPLCGYAWIGVSELPFSDRVRYICETECPRYGKSWSCPPAVGTVEECRKRAESYDGAFVFTTAAETEDIENLELTLKTRGAHEEVTRRAAERFLEAGYEVLALSGDSCAHCARCTYPDSPCRFPKEARPCVEGYGIAVPLLAERCGLEFWQGSNTVTWFSVILFRRAEEKGARCAAEDISCGKR